mgnify:CR=1 FL=1
MIPLGEIIEKALPFINTHLDDDYDKYHIEKQLKWQSNRDWENNLMPQIVRRWAIDEKKIISISCRHHDVETVAFEFDTIEDLETHLTSLSSVLNPFITYEIPIIYGKVKWFRFLNQDGEIIKIEDFIETNQTSFENISLIWD